MQDLAAGDVVELKRRHPCGSSGFVVTMVGLDIRLSCTGCGARLILSREKLRARLQTVEPFVAQPQDPSEPLQNTPVNPLHRGES